MTSDRRIKRYGITRNGVFCRSSRFCDGARERGGVGEVFLVKDLEGSEDWSLEETDQKWDLVMCKKLRSEGKYVGGDGHIKTDLLSEKGIGEPKVGYILIFRFPKPQRVWDPETKKIIWITESYYVGSCTKRDRKSVV